MPRSGTSKSKGDTALRKHGWRQKLMLVTALVAVGMLSGCSSVVARVNGQDITRKQFHDHLEKRAGLQVLTELIARRLILERAKAEGCAPSNEEVLAEFNKQKKEQFGGDETKMRAFMRQNGLDDPAMLDDLRVKLAMFKLQTKGVKADDATLEAFFTENHEKLFDKPARYTFRMIGVESADAAKKALAELNGSNKLFEDVVQQYSHDATRENGGLVEELPVEQVGKASPPLAEALKGLKENQVTQEPISFRGNFWILKLIKKLPAEAANFKDAATKEKVKTTYLASKAKDQQQLLEELSRTCKLQVMEERFKAPLEQQFGGPAQAAPGNVPAPVADQLKKGPDMAAPTHVEPGAVPPAEAGEGAKGAKPAPAPAPAAAPGK